MDVKVNSKTLQKLTKKYSTISSIAQTGHSEPLSAASVYKTQASEMPEKNSETHSPRPKKRKKKKSISNSSDKETSASSSSWLVDRSKTALLNEIKDPEWIDDTDSMTVDQPEGSDDNLELTDLSAMEPEFETNVHDAVYPPEDVLQKKGKLSRKNEQKKRRSGSISTAEPRVSEVVGGRFVSELIWSSVTNGAYLYLPKYTSLGLKGRVKLTVLKGRVEVMGAILEASSKSFEVYSPRGYSLAVINGLDSLAEFNLHDFSSERNLPLDKAPDVNEILLLLEKIDNGLTRFLEEHLDSNLLRNEVTLETDLTKDELRPQKDLHRLLQCNILTKQVQLKARYYEENPEWRSIVASILEFANPMNCRVALCGGKGVGKSTLLRYIVNNLLKTHNEILVIDLDPGQAEFTMPTCLSVVSVTEPLFGPNFTHLKKPEKSLYIGTVDVSSAVSAYCEAVRKLFQWFAREKKYHGKPCVINTMGFNSGIGADLLVDTLRIGNPTHVVEINSRSAKRNYPFPLDPHTVSTVNYGRFTKQSPGDFLLGYQYFRISSASESAAQPVNEWGHKPSQLREYVVLAYLSQLLSEKGRPSQAVATAKPIQIPFSKVAVASVAEAVKPQYMLGALNGSLVSLCKAELETLQLLYPDDPSLFMIAERPLPAECIGFGVITRVDTDAKCFHIVTPESETSTVNLLCLGKLALPDVVYFGGNSQKPFEMTRHPGGSRVVVPYVAESVIHEGISQPLRHYNPFRPPKM